MHAKEPYTDDQAERLRLLGLITMQLVHDLGGRLTGAVGNLDLALSDIDAEHPSRELLCLSRRLMDDMIGLRAWLLAFARGDTREAQLLDLGALVAQSLPILAGLIGSQIQIVTTLTPGCYVEADPAALQRVLFNLLLNAQQAITAEGTIEIAVRKRASRVVLSIQDDGCGMSRAVLSQILTPFYTTKPGGTGLGLATCRQLLMPYGGGLEISSTVGVGTTVRVLLPAV